MTGTQDSETAIVANHRNEIEPPSKRPAHIKQDMREMEQRKRVSLILNSEAFREELEAIIESQLKEGPHAASLMALQKIADLILPPNSRSGQSRASSRGMLPITPIYDVRGTESSAYSKGEKLTRCKLASLYRLIDINGYVDDIFNSVSVRLPGDQEQFLIHPTGLQYYEVSAGSLVKVDTNGTVLEAGNTTYGFNKASWGLHTAIYDSRPEIKCIAHVNYPAVLAVANMKEGLLPLSVSAIIIGETSTSDILALSIGPDQKETIARDLGTKSKVLLMKNHGAVVCGESIEEVFGLLQHFNIACETQVRTLACISSDDITLPSKDAISSVRVEYQEQKMMDMSSTDRKYSSQHEMVFESMMRMLDEMGYRTGYIYQYPLVRREIRNRSEVEVPPASSSQGYVYEEDYENDRYASPHRILDSKRPPHSTWLNSPNVYTRVEVVDDECVNVETSPKTKTKWVQEHAPPGMATSTPIKISDPHQFSKPGSENPYEMRQKQKQIKQERRDDRISAGPQSQVLMGVSWVDAKKLQEAGDLTISASKGIIQKDYQADAVFLTDYSQPNPFENTTDDELETYRRTIERKTQGLPTEEEIRQQETVVITTETVRDGDKTVTTTTTKKEIKHGGKEEKVKKHVKHEKKSATLPAEALSPPAGAARDSTLSRDSSSSSEDEKEKSKEEKSPKKKKSKGLRTPSFLKRKKEKEGKDHHHEDKKEKKKKHKKEKEVSEKEKEKAHEVEKERAEE